MRQPLESHLTQRAISLARDIIAERAILAAANERGDIRAHIYSTRKIARLQSRLTAGPPAHRDLAVAVALTVSGYRD